MVENLSSTSCKVAVKSRNSAITRSPTAFDSSMLPSHDKCYLPAWTAYNFTTQQIFAGVQKVPAFDITTLGDRRVGGQARGSHDLDGRAGEGERGERIPSYKQTAFHLWFCLCSWMYFQFGREDVPGQNTSRRCSRGSNACWMNKSQTVRNDSAF